MNPVKFQRTPCNQQQKAFFCLFVCRPIYVQSQDVIKRKRGTRLHVHIESNQDNDNNDGHCTDENANVISSVQFCFRRESVHRCGRRHRSTLARDSACGYNHRLVAVVEDGKIFPKEWISKHDEIAWDIV